MKKTMLALAGALLLAASGAASAQNMAIVNGKSIPKARFDAIMADLKEQSAQSGRPLAPDVEKRLKERLIQSAVIVQAAEAKGLNLTPQYREKMEQARESVLASLLLEQYKKEHLPSDAAAKAVYDKELGSQQGSNEYHVRHILVKTAPEAQKVLSELKKGANFATLAEKYSQDSTSARRGGDLDWAPATVYVPPFASAVAKMKKGETSSNPVKSEFGYHIIRLEDVRPAKVPAFDQVKGQIKQEMQQDVMPEFQKYIQNLQSKAKIQ